MTHRRSSPLGIALLVAAVAIGSGCSSKDEKKGASGLAAIASGSLAVTAPPPVHSVSAAAEPEKPIIKRCKDQGDLVLTPEKRARVERLAPEAKGFVTVGELE